MREIVLDVETTGISADEGHRIISLGCVELIDGGGYGKQLEWFFNPERDIPPESFAVHGITAEFLADKPKFAALADEILAFLGEDTPLVIHNAEFDLSFLNAELAKCGRPRLVVKRAVDTLQLARYMFPGQKASLDELARRFKVSLEGREKHGALLDAQILAKVYAELLAVRDRQKAKSVPTTRIAYKRSEVIIHRLKPEEKANHEKLLAELKLKNWRYAPIKSGGNSNE